MPNRSIALPTILLSLLLPICLGAVVHVPSRAGLERRHGPDNWLYTTAGPHAATGTANIGMSTNTRKRKPSMGSLDGYVEPPKRKKVILSEDEIEPERSYTVKAESIQLLKKDRSYLRLEFTHPRRVFYVGPNKTRHKFFYIPGRDLSEEKKQILRCLVGYDFGLPGPTIVPAIIDDGTEFSDEKFHTVNVEKLVKFENLAIASNDDEEEFDTSEGYTLPEKELEPKWAYSVEESRIWVLEDGEYRRPVRKTKNKNRKPRRVLFLDKEREPKFLTMLPNKYFEKKAAEEKDSLCYFDGSHFGLPYTLVPAMIDPDTKFKMPKRHTFNLEGLVKHVKLTVALATMTALSDDENELDTSGEKDTDIKECPLGKDAIKMGASYGVSVLRIQILQMDGSLLRPKGNQFRRLYYLGPDAPYKFFYLRENKSKIIDESCWFEGSEFGFRGFKILPAVVDDNADFRNEKVHKKHKVDKLTSLSQFLVQSVVWQPQVTLKDLWHRVSLEVLMNEGGETGGEQRKTS